jgi:anti-sigma B factor antagonist
VTETTFAVRSAESGDLVVTVAGELDANVAGRFEGEIRAGLFTSDATRLVIDLTDVGFIDSTALGVIIGARNQMRERDGIVVLRRPGPTVARLLDVTLLAGELEIES